MRHFYHVCLILLSLVSINLLSGHNVTNQADFWTGVAGALIGCILAGVIVDLMRD